MRPTLWLLPGIALLALACSGSGPVPVTPADKAIIYTASDVARDFGTFQIDPSLETWELEREFDGSYMLTYEYAGEDQPDVLVVSMVVNRDSDPSDADYTMMGLELGLSIGLDDSVGQREANDVLNWGEKSDCTLLVNEGTPVGTICVFKKGRYTGLMSMVGAVWTDPDEATVAMAAQLAAIESWDPQQMPAE